MIGIFILNAYRSNEKRWKKFYSEPKNPTLSVSNYIDSDFSRKQRLKYIITNSTWATSDGGDCSTGAQIRPPRSTVVVAAERHRIAVAAAIAGVAVVTAAAGNGGARGRCTCCCRAPAAAAWCRRPPAAVPDRIVQSVHALTWRINMSPLLDRRRWRTSSIAYLLKNRIVISHNQTLPYNY